MKLEEKVNYMGWPNCLRLSNSEIEVIIATDIGLRILRFGFIDGQNILYLSPEDKGKQGGDGWRIFGGHRLWHSPEAIPRSYSPDNDPISYRYDQQTLKITQPVEETTGIVKEMEISLSPDLNQLRILHRLINMNLWDVKLSAWALSALAENGLAIIPQEPFGEGDAYLLPARSLALWSYARMEDPRWSWGNKYIRARQDPSRSSEQKIGLMNKQGWAAYCLNEDLLIKVFDFDPVAEYPDFGSNQEIYINGRFLEMETLGPLVNVPPKGKTEQVEHWLLSRAKTGETDESVERELIPRLSCFQDRLSLIRKK
ncbi:MAG TPA: hypothetical protein VGM24_06385 [Puia sp.]|jgi:hypothetical protein